VTQSPLRAPSVAGLTVAGAAVLRSFLTPLSEYPAMLRMTEKWGHGPPFRASGRTVGEGCLRRFPTRRSADEEANDPLPVFPSSCWLRRAAAGWLGRVGAASPLRVVHGPRLAPAVVLVRSPPDEGEPGQWHFRNDERADERLVSCVLSSPDPRQAFPSPPAFAPAVAFFRRGLESL
jgi:hypothetical protein